jgi:tRNA (guanine37-N1)-methyltransferase
MRIDILTLFPNICTGPLNESMMKRAQAQGALDLHVHNIRDWTTDKHRMTDDTPYGGGAGMVMKAEPLFNAVEELRTPAARVILLTPQGRVFKQALAREYSRLEHLILICGHYEGIDHRVVDHLVDEELSLGDFVLTNGAIAANVVVDSVVRLIPGVLGHELSAEHESFSEPTLLEGPHYTKPVEFRGWRVPDVLLSGHHAEIEKWRKEQGRLRTEKNRPDLLHAPERTGDL